MLAISTMLLVQNPTSSLSRQLDDWSGYSRNLGGIGTQWLGQMSPASRQGRWLGINKSLDCVIV
jgi:hypothetical protein